MEEGARPVRFKSPVSASNWELGRKMETLFFVSLSLPLSNITEAELTYFITNAVVRALLLLGPSQNKLYQDSTKFTFPKKNAQAFKVR